MSDPAGPLLAIDSSSVIGSVAVGTSAGVVAELSLGVKAGHSSALLPAIDYALRSAGLAPPDLQGVVVGAGPGSFTGLRIAGATAKGIVQALEVPLYAYSSLLTTASQAWAFPGTVCALFDARGRDVYVAAYRFGRVMEVVLSPRAAVLEEVVRILAGEEDVLFVGDGSQRHGAELEERWPGSVGPPHFGAPRAAALLWLVGRAPEGGRVNDPAGWQPDYLRASGAERIAAARGAGGAEP